MVETGEGDDKRAVTTLRWKGRTHLNFIAGRSRLRALPVVIHLLPDDIDWFSEDPTLFKELQTLLQDRVISIMNSGEKDPEATKSRKRARKEELCIQSSRLQFTYRYRKTLPRYTVLSYEEVDSGIESLGEGNKVNSATKPSENKGPNFRHFPLSDSTLLVWVYRFNPEDPYATVPNEAALQFAPSTTLQQSSAKAFDPEAIGRDVGRATGSLGMRAGPRETGILAWLWGSENGDKGNDGKGAGGVRQHFIGSAAWEGRPTIKRGHEEDEDIQRAIALSLSMASGDESGWGGKGAGGDVVEVLDDA